MKIAILGTGPVGLHMALEMGRLGAAVTLFGKGSMGGSIRRLSTLNPSMSLEKSWDELTTSAGRSLVQTINELDRTKTPTVGEYWEKYLSPMILSGEFNGLVKEGEVLRVHKRFLFRDEIVQGRSRLCDLFRVVFKRCPKEGILKQVQENPEVFEKLGEEVLNSLQDSIESFEDFDIVVEATGPYEKHLPAGAGGAWALNEKTLKKSTQIFYGSEALEKSFEPGGSKNIMICGSGELAAELSLSLWKWLNESKENHLHLVTSEKTPFARLEQENNCPDRLSRIHGMIDEFEGNWREECSAFEREIRGWRELPDYERAKIPMPKMPVPKFIPYNGYNITSIDKLLDKEGLFVTIECPNFRKADEDMKTIGVDLLLVANGTDNEKSLAEGLRLNRNEEFHSEPGFYTIGTRADRNLKDALLQIPKIKENILSFFTRREEDA